MREYLTAPRFDHDISQHIALCLDALEARFGPQAEQELHRRFVDWMVFETATEPALQDYAYTRWSNARLRAQWQIRLLRAFLERHHQAEKTQKCLDLWEHRVDIIQWPEPSLQSPQIPLQVPPPSIGFYAPSNGRIWP